MPEAGNRHAAAGRRDGSLFFALWRGLLNLVYPLTCARCGATLDPSARDPVCPGCWEAIPRIEQPYCPRCGRPVRSGARVPFDMPCGDCRLTPRRFGIARSAGRYEGALRDLVHAMKYGGERRIAGALSRLMEECRGRLFDDFPYDALVPVPLRRSKMKERGYNQAELIARGLAVATGVPALAGVLARREGGSSQSLLRRAERLVNVKGAFVPRAKADVTGMRLLLVDDVFTTGATADECVRVRLAAGARGVDVYTAARAV